MNTTEVSSPRRKLMPKKKGPLTSARLNVRRNTEYSERVSAIKEDLQGRSLEMLAQYRRCTDDDKVSAEDLLKNAGERIEGVNAVMSDKMEAEGIMAFVDKLGNKFSRVVKIHASIKVENVEAFIEKFKATLGYLWSQKPNSASLSAYVNGLLEEGRNPDELITVFEKQTIRRKKP